MSDEYTPDDETVANSYARGRGVISIRALAEFDRWLAGHDAGVWESGLNTGVGYAAVMHLGLPEPQNPYRPND